nr:MAG TPA: hypothetical protein [Caudoviricetes sp.]
MIQSTFIASILHFTVYFRSSANLISLFSVSLISFR